MAAFEAQKDKIGNFDWITEYDEIEGFLQSNYTGLTHINKKDTRVLVAGCGTSQLSFQLANSGFGEIISVDNDEECISHMKKMHFGDERLKWYVYDMVEPESTSPSQEFLDIVLGKFDLIVDKGTLDAILVEGKYSNNATIYTHYFPFSFLPFFLPFFFVPFSSLDVCSAFLLLFTPLDIFDLYQKHLTSYFLNVLIIYF